MMDSGSVSVRIRSEEHTSELQSRLHIVCRLLLEKKNVLGYARDFHGELSVLAVQVLEQPGDGRLVLADHAPFGLALPTHTEDIELRAAQALQFHENAERRHHPGSELRLPRLAGARIGPVEDRRGGAARAASATLPRTP